MEGANLEVNVANTLTTTQGGIDLSLFTPIGHTLGIGGNLTLSVGGDLLVGPPGAQGGLGPGISLALYNTISTTVGQGANLTGSVTGRVAVDFVDLLLDNSSNGGVRTGGNLSFVVGGSLNTFELSAVVNNTSGGSIVSGANLFFRVGGDLFVGGDANFELLNGFGTIGSNAAVTLSANTLSVGGSLNAYIDNRNGSIGPNGNGGSLALQVNGNFQVTGVLNVLGSTSGGVNITAGTVAGTSVTAVGNINAGQGGIRRSQYPDVGREMFAGLHTLTAGSTVLSDGGINFDGAAADSSVPVAGDGGSLLIAAASLNLGPGGISGPITFNGGDALSSSASSTPGSGGSFAVNTTGDLMVTSDIEATSGRIAAAATQPSGNGGSVQLNSRDGLVSVASRIEVSSTSQAPSPTPPPRRLRATGGNITISSGKIGGAAGRVRHLGRSRSISRIAVSCSRFSRRPRRLSPAGESRLSRVG